MLKESSMPKLFWVEVATTAFCLINRSPNATLNFKVREELWNGFKPNYDHLRIFGSTAFVPID